MLDGPITSVPIGRNLQLRCIGADTTILDPDNSVFTSWMTGRTGVLINRENAEWLLSAIMARNEGNGLRFVILKVKLYVDKNNPLEICQSIFNCGWNTYDAYIGGNMKILHEL